MPSKLIEIICPVCNAIFARRESDIKDAIKASGEWKCGTCSRKIRNKLNALPIGSKREHQGAILIKTDNGWELEHRVVMAQKINRELDPGEDVHHINKNRKDNRVKNLILLPKEAHMRLHHFGVKRSKETCMKISKKVRERSSMTPDEVLRIRAEYIPHKHGYGAIAREHNVNRSAIIHIINNRTWRDIECSTNAIS